MYSANTRRWPNVGLFKLSRRLRRWSNINTALVQRLVFDVYINYIGQGFNIAYSLRFTELLRTAYFEIPENQKQWIWAMHYVGAHLCGMTIVRLLTSIAVV